MSDDKPSIAELQRQIDPSGDLAQQSVLLRADVACALLEIVAAALALREATCSGYHPECIRHRDEGCAIWIANEALTTALAKVRP